jgi:hypothetical protein
MSTGIAISKYRRVFRKGLELAMLSFIFFLAAPVLTASGKTKPIDDFFTTPETKLSPAPVFASRTPRPANPSALGLEDGEMPRQEIIGTLPTLTEDQRKQMRKYFDDMNKQNRAVTDQIPIFEKRLKELSATKAKPAATSAQTSPTTPPSTTEIGHMPTASNSAQHASDDSQVGALAVQNAPGIAMDALTAGAGEQNMRPLMSMSEPPPTAPSRFELIVKQAGGEARSMTNIDQVKTRIAALKLASKQNANTLSTQLSSLLSADQLNQVDKMRRGTLVITGDNSLSDRPDLTKR